MAKSAVVQSRELEHKLIVRGARYATVMSAVALLVGVLYREGARPFFRDVPLEEQLLYGHAMSTVHGHTFLLGAAIPLGLVLLTYLARQALTPKATRQLHWLLTAYVVSSVAVIALMLYKGMAFIVGTGQGLDATDAALFFGSVGLRSALYGLAHTALAVSMVWYAAKVLRALSRFPR